MKQLKYTDYVDRIHEHFPSVNKDSIENIIKWGLKRIYQFACLKQDIYLNVDNSDNPFYLFIGHKDGKSGIKQTIRSKRREHFKLRRIYKENKVEYNGLFYFGLTDEELELFKKEGKTNRVVVYKVIEETHIRNNVNHIFSIEISGKSSRTWLLNRYDLTMNDCKYLFKREGKIFVSAITE